MSGMQSWCMEDGVEMAELDHGGHQVVQPAVDPVASSQIVGSGMQRYKKAARLFFLNGIPCIAVTTVFVAAVVYEMASNDRQAASILSLDTRALFNQPIFNGTLPKNTADCRYITEFDRRGIQWINESCKDVYYSVSSSSSFANIMMPPIMAMVLMTFFYISKMRDNKVEVQ